VVSASYAIAAVVVDDLVATVACACCHPKVLDVVATVLPPNASDWDARDAGVAAAAHTPHVSPARVNPCLQGENNIELVLMLNVSCSKIIIFKNNIFFGIIVFKLT